ncbi:hypothetical protein M2321_002870 [Rhodoblastus acidophilus]|nr:hypothetical protein [Rhodoblastus acidophilus]
MTSDAPLRFVRFPAHLLRKVSHRVDALADALSATIRANTKPHWR